jgi:hypothetical protein
LHCESIAHPAHSFFDLSQMGFAAVVHWASSTHATQVFVVGEHAGVAPEHSAFVLHWAHRPPGAQTGAAELFALHWASSVQATQAFVPLSQMGLSAAPQWVSSVQVTHRLFTQKGVAPMH